MINNKNNNSGNGYVLSQQEYNTLNECVGKIQDILSHARVVENGKEVLQPAKPVSKEILTSESAQRFLGGLYNNVVYYNHDSNSWNRREISNEGFDTAGAEWLKIVLESQPVFKDKYELVANVTITVDSKEYPGLAKWAKNVKYSSKGTAVLGNLIVRAKTTGRLELWNSAWLGVDDCGDPSDAADSAVVFAFSGAVDPIFRAALCSVRVR